MLIPELGHWPTVQHAHAPCSPSNLGRSGELAAFSEGGRTPDDHVEMPGAARLVNEPSAL
ncbi:MULTISPECIES: hypothetical protein [unclassified Streptomyces]|uniref:hypothetical protein n=1 Tax=unclassified Streptomyces TaxID=2593676 RepID=UPI002E371A1F|nr:MULTISPECIES: hypothetical protein [unclassified Streptomyces]WUC68077.1 hypothetical protein OG861_29685 [Streptomyces sp. NBC_00539]